MFFLNRILKHAKRELISRQDDVIASTPRKQLETTNIKPVQLNQLNAILSVEMTRLQKCHAVVDQMDDDLNSFQAEASR